MLLLFNLGEKCWVLKYGHNKHYHFFTLKMSQLFVQNLKNKEGKQKINFI